jgi:hypothetical protein
MERQKAPYSLNKRPASRKNRHVYYVRFRDDNGDYMSAVSTGCGNRDDAVRWCEQHLKDGRRESGVSLEAYSKDFWKGEGAYAQGKLAHSYTLTAGTLHVADRITEKHSPPKWGKYPLR